MKDDHRWIQEHSIHQHEKHPYAPLTTIIAPFSLVDVRSTTKWNYFINTRTWCAKNCIVELQLSVDALYTKFLLLLRNPLNHSWHSSFSSSSSSCSCRCCFLSPSVVVALFCWFLTHNTHDSNSGLWVPWKIIWLDYLSLPSVGSVRRNTKFHHCHRPNGTKVVLLQILI